MATCNICGKEIGLFQMKKCADGQICKECYEKLPDDIELSLLTVAQISAMMERKTNDYEKIFSETAGYGDLKIDETHGLFALSNNGKIRNNVFSVLEIQEVELYCKTPKVDHENVYCNVEFTFVLSIGQIPIKKTVKHKVHCLSKRTDSQHIAWDEPGDLSMFKSIFNHMIKETIDRYNQQLGKVTPYDYALKTSMDRLFLTSDYTKDELEQKYNLLYQLFSENNLQNETEILQRSYEMLKMHLNRRDQ